MEYQPEKPESSKGMRGLSLPISPINMSQPERALYILSGAVLIAFGLFKRGTAWVAVPAGLFVAVKGAMGNSPLYRRLGVTNAVKTNPQQVSVPHEQGVHVHEAITIQAAANEIYARLKDPETLEQILDPVEQVNLGDPQHGEWVIELPGGVQTTLAVELVNEKHGEVIAWRSAPGSPIAHAGSVRFMSSATEGETEVRVELEYVPPAGAIGVGIAKVLGVEPSMLAAEALKNLKQLIEEGEITHATAKTGRKKRSEKKVKDAGEESV